MRRSLLGLAAVPMVLFAACGSDDADDANGSSATEAPAASLPAQCAPAPYTVTAMRDGEQPIGSEQFGVVSAVAVQIPLVPNKSGQLTTEQVLAQQDTTELVGYAILFADEQIDPSSVSLFGGWDPVEAGKVRGNVGIYPNTPVPFAVGDVITPGTIDGLEMVTTLNRIGLDLKNEAGQLNAYLGTPQGSVTILGLNADTICLDVDLTWEYSDFGSEPVGTLTLKGVFTAALGPRTMSLT